MSNGKRDVNFLDLIYEKHTLCSTHTFRTMPLAIDVGQRVLVYNPSHGWTMAYFVRAQQTHDNKLQILVSAPDIDATARTRCSPS